MGTNYYFYEKQACKCCGRDFERIHIGKSSAGWCFSLHVYPENGIKDLDDWETKWTIMGSRIRNEYGQEITPQEMEKIIQDRGWPKKNEIPTVQWLNENRAVPGPKGLARHRIDGQHCTGHGEGTWDLIIGEFS